MAELLEEAQTFAEGRRTDGGEAERPVRSGFERLTDEQGPARRKNAVRIAHLAKLLPKRDLRVGEDHPCRADPGPFQQRAAQAFGGSEGPKSELQVARWHRQLVGQSPRGPRHQMTTFWPTMH